MLTPRWLRCTCLPSTYQVAELSALLHSKVYRWKLVVQDGVQLLTAPFTLPPLPTPSFSLHTFGPLPGASQPQCCVCQVRLRPLTFSMMSNSPMVGQFHQLPRYGAPRIQKAGQ